MIYDDSLSVCLLLCTSLQPKLVGSKNVMLTLRSIMIYNVVIFFLMFKAQSHIQFFIWCINIVFGYKNIQNILLFFNLTLY